MVELFLYCIFSLIAETVKAAIWAFVFALAYKAVER